MMTEISVSFRAEIQIARGTAWAFVAECQTSEDAWHAICAHARDYYAAQVIYPKESAT